jgi:hypothetical protein
MPRPTAAQLAELHAGHRPPMVGAHTVGAPDGGPGLPLTRWSTEGGDLRVPHFVGLHALQVLPILGWVFERRRRAAAAPRVLAAGAGWIGLFLLTLWQALRGQPVLAPDAATLFAAELLVLTTALVGALAQALYARVGAGKPQEVPSVISTSASQGSRYWPATRSRMKV